LTKCVETRLVRRKARAIAPTRTLDMAMLATEPMAKATAMMTRTRPHTAMTPIMLPPGPLMRTPGELLFDKLVELVVVAIPHVKITNLKDLLS